MPRPNPITRCKTVNTSANISPVVIESETISRGLGCASLWGSLPASDDKRPDWDLLADDMGIEKLQGGSEHQRELRAYCQIGSVWISELFLTLRESMINVWLSCFIRAGRSRDITVVGSITRTLEATLWEGGNWWSAGKSCFVRSASEYKAR